MIAHLRGKLVQALPTRVVVDVNGVGYEVFIPLSSFEKLPPLGGDILLLTHLCIRDDAHILYGFITEEERDLFKILISSVTGIGPKIALNILSGMTPSAFRGAVSEGNIRALSQISGVGKKTAERIIVELRDKFGVAGVLTARSDERALTPEEQKLNDAILALIALEFSQTEAQKAVREAYSQLGSKATVEELVRVCLKKLS